MQAARTDPLGRIGIAQSLVQSLPQEDGIVGLNQLSHRSENIDELGLISVENVLLPPVRPDPGRQAPKEVPARGIGPTVSVLDVAVEDIESKSRDPSVEPKAHDLQHLSANLWVAPVQIWLLRKKAVQIAGARRLGPRPGRASHDAGPVVGWSLRWMPVKVLSSS